jgi:hypothetical protein
MSKQDKNKPTDARSDRPADPTTSAGGGHHAAKAHGQPATVDGSLPGTREELAVLHAAARQRRASAPLGSPEHRAAVDELGRIEIRIAAVERAMTPPRG